MQRAARKSLEQKAPTDAFVASTTTFSVGTHAGDGSEEAINWLDVGAGYSEPDVGGKEYEKEGRSRRAPAGEPPRPPPG